MNNRIRIILSFLIFSFFLGIPQKSFNLKASSENIEDINKEIIEKNFYILGPGDNLFINFLDLPEISGEFLIMSDGNIQLPLIGAQSFTGLTLDNAITKLKSLYKNELIRPQVDLQLLNARPLKISMIGEISRPGSYTLDVTEEDLIRKSSPKATVINGLPTVVDAIQKAGGLTFEADITNISIYRNLPGNNNELKKAKLDLLDLLQTGNQANNPILFDGDIIEIPKIDSKTAKNLENIPNNLTPDTITLYVIGDVAIPGKYDVAANTNIRKAILIAGGPNSLTSKNKVEHLRVSRNGSVEVNKISFKNKASTKKNKEFSLRDGDIIKVNKNLFGKSTEALGKFAQPAGNIYSVYGLYKLLD